MIDVISVVPKLVGVVIVVNIITFAYIYVLAQTDFIKWEDKYNSIILMILNLMSGYIGIAVSTKMYGYRTESKFIKVVIPVTFIIEVLIIALILGRDYIPVLIQKIQ